MSDKKLISITIQFHFDENGEAEAPYSVQSVQPVQLKKRHHQVLNEECEDGGEFKYIPFQDLEDLGDLTEHQAREAENYITLMQAVFGDDKDLSFLIIPIEKIK